MFSSCNSSQEMQGKSRPRVIRRTPGSSDHEEKMEFGRRVKIKKGNGERLWNVGKHNQTTAGPYTVGIGVSVY